MTALRFDPLRDEREMHQGELWVTKGPPTFPASPSVPAPHQPRVVVILSPDDLHNAPHHLDVRVAPLSPQVDQASAFDLQLDVPEDVTIDSPEDQDMLAPHQMIELWNDQSMLKIHLDRRLGICTESVQDRIKQVLRWNYGVELCQATPPWVGKPIEEQADARLRFQEQEREATRFLREPVEQLYRLLAEDESEEMGEAISADAGEEAEDIVAFEAWQEEFLREHQEGDERLSRFLRERLPADALAVLKGPCPDTPTFVAYQEGALPIGQAEEIQRHVVFCRACLEELVALGRADEVDDDPTRDYAVQVNLPPALRQELFGHLAEPVVTELLAAQLDEPTTRAHLRHLAVCRRCLQEVTTALQARRVVVTSIYLAHLALLAQRARVEGRRRRAAAGELELPGVIHEPDGTERPVRVPVHRNPPHLTQQGVFTLTLREPDAEDFEGCTVQVLLGEETLAEGTFTGFACQLQQEVSDELLRYVRLLLEADDFPVELSTADLRCRIQRRGKP